MHSFGRVICYIMVAILLFLLPLQYIYDNHDQSVHSQVLQSTTNFTEFIKQEGYLTYDMYNSFTSELSATGELFNIEIEISKPKVGVTSVSDTRELKTSLLDTKSELSASNLLYTNKTNIQSSLLSTHTHSAACYDGDLHAHSSYGGSCYTYYDNTYWVSHTHTSSCYHTHTSSSGSCYSSSTCTGTVSYNYTRSTSNYCSTCKKNVTTEGYSPRCGSCGSGYGEVWRLSCGHSSTNISSRPCSSTVRNLTCTISTTTAICGETGYWAGSSGYNFSCTLNTTTYYKNKIAVPATCNQVVVSIVATSVNQTVIQGTPIVTTAIATYLDGHTATINCSNDYKGIIGTQSVILTYSGRVGTAKTTGVRTATTVVVTQPNKKPLTLTVTPSSSTVYNGTEPTYTVRVNYDDNTNKIITTGYTKTGFTKGAGLKTVVFSYTENGIKVNGTVIITVKRNTKTCRYGHTYELDDFDVDNGCSICASTVTSISATPFEIKVPLGGSIKDRIKVIATYLDGHTKIINNWLSNFVNTKVGTQLVEIIYENHKVLVTVEVVNKLVCATCGNEYDSLEDGTDPGCPICKDQIVSLRAIPNEITLSVGTELNITVLATYRDGNTSEVFGWTSNFDSNKVGLQNVTIFYNQFSTNIRVNVIGDRVTCDICGTEYILKDFPLGCPVCSKQVISIEAYLRNGGNTVSYGSELYINVVLNFRDGHKELATGGWTIENYNQNLLGEQAVLVKYTGNLTYTLNIIVVNNLAKKICDNGHVYYLNDDGTDSGCPYCLNLDLDNSGIEYDVVLFINDIIKELENNNVIYFESGDYITIKITPRKIQKKFNLLNFIYNLENETTPIILGGKIIT